MGAQELNLGAGGNCGFGFSLSDFRIEMNWKDGLKLIQGSELG